MPSMKAEVMNLRFREAEGKDCVMAAARLNHAVTHPL